MNVLDALNLKLKQAASQLEMEYAEHISDMLSGIKQRHGFGNFGSMAGDEMGEGEAPHLNEDVVFVDLNAGTRGRVKLTPSTAASVSRTGRRRSLRPLQGNRGGQGAFALKQEAWRGQHRKVLGKQIKVVGEQKALIGDEVKLRVYDGAFTRAVGQGDARMRVRYITLASHFDSCANNPWFYHWHEL